MMRLCASAEVRGLDLSAPGGVSLNADVPYQSDKLSIAKQMTNHWPVRNNGEAFWSGFAYAELSELLVAADFSQDEVRQTYEPLGKGVSGAVDGRLRAVGRIGPVMQVWHRLEAVIALLIAYDGERHLDGAL